MILRPETDSVLELAQHAVIGSVVGDILGRTLNQYDPHERSYVVGTWVKQSRGEYPPNLKRPEKTGKPSRNSQVLLLMLEFLADHTPLTERRLAEFDEHYSDLIEPYLIEREEHQFIVGASLATGFWQGLMSLRSDTDQHLLDGLLLRMYDPIAGISGWYCLENISAMRTLIYIMRRTMLEGYFGAAVVERAIDLGICTGALGAVLDTFNKTRLTRTFLSASVPDERWLSGLTYFERLLCITLFYLYKIDAGVKGIKKPRYMIEDMVRLTGVALQDLLMVFSALCLCSEHNYLLFVAPLQDSVPMREDLIDTLKQSLA